MKLAAAVTFLIAAIASADADTAAPDFSGLWEGPGFDLDAAGNDPGPVTNVSGDIQKPEGDWKNPILQPWAAKIVKQWADDTHAGKLPPHAHALCWPTGTPGAMTLHQAYQFLQGKEQVVILIANQAQFRHVYLDAPHSKSPEPSWYGESVGHYEGDTLVIDTVGIKAKDIIPVDRFGTPHTGKLHVVERIHKTGPKDLVIDYLIEDAGAFTTPWRATMTFHPTHGWEEQICSENNIDITGKLAEGLPQDFHPAF